jgi:hypothetical protein
MFSGAIAGFSSMCVADRIIRNRKVDLQKPADLIGVLSSVITGSAAGIYGESRRSRLAQESILRREGFISRLDELTAVAERSQRKLW